MKTLSIILEESFENDSFSFWFPSSSFGIHLIVSSNGPDKIARDFSLKTLLAAAKYRGSLAYFRNMTDFNNLLRGKSKIRSDRVKMLGYGPYGMGQKNGKGFCRSF